MISMKKDFPLLEDIKNKIPLFTFYKKGIKINEVLTPNSIDPIEIVISDHHHKEIHAVKVNRYFINFFLLFVIIFFMINYYYNIISH